MRTHLKKPMAAGVGALVLAFLLPGSAAAQTEPDDAGLPPTERGAVLERVQPPPRTPERVTSDVLPPVPATPDDPAPPGTRAVPAEDVLEGRPLRQPEGRLDYRRTTGIPRQLPDGVHSAEGVVVRLERTNSDEPDTLLRFEIDPSQDWDVYALNQIPPEVVPGAPDVVPGVEGAVPGGTQRAPVPTIRRPPPPTVPGAVPEETRPQPIPAPPVSAPGARQPAPEAVVPGGERLPPPPAGTVPGDQPPPTPEAPGVIVPEDRQPPVPAPEAARAQEAQVPVETRAPEAIASREPAGDDLQNDGVETQEAADDEPEAADQPDTISLVVTPRSRIYTFSRTADGRLVSDEANPYAPVPDVDDTEPGPTGRVSARAPGPKVTNFSNIREGAYVAVFYREDEDGTNEVLSLSLVHLAEPPTGTDPGFEDVVPGFDGILAPSRRPVHTPSLPATPVGPTQPR